MLVDKKPNNQTVMSFKMITGEEIIARLIDDQGEVLKISRPLAMVMAENPDNPTQTRVMFTPWMVSAGSELLSLDKSKIIVMCKAREDAAEQYENAIVHS